MERGTERATTACRIYPAYPAHPACPVGAHARVAGGIGKGAVRHVRETAAEAIQVFVSNPQGWTLPPGDADQDRVFRDHMARAGIPAFVHAPYLVNFGSPSGETVRRSGAATGHALQRGHEIGACGVVVHTGSAVSDDPAAAMQRVREHLLPLLDGLPAGGPDLLLEPTAGQGQSLCSRVEDLGSYLDALDWHPRLGACLDTCHLFAAGHDLAAPHGVAAMLATFDNRVGRERLRLVHANDSVAGCGSRKDRHHNIGKGELGEQPFRELLHHPVVAGVPLVVETPGRAAQHGQDVQALKRLRQCHNGGPSPASSW